MPSELKAPLIVKILLLIAVLGLAYYTIIIPILKGGENKKEFYKQEFSSIVVSSSLFHKRTVEFHLENGVTVYFLPPIKGKLIVGDSIRKEKNTYQYDVYRKNNFGEYTFFKTYSIEHIQ